MNDEPFKLYTLYLVDQAQCVLIDWATVLDWRDLATNLKGVYVVCMTSNNSILLIQISTNKIPAVQNSFVKYRRPCQNNVATLNDTRQKESEGKADVCTFYVSDLLSKRNLLANQTSSESDWVTECRFRSIEYISAWTSIRTIKQNIIVSIWTYP